MNQILYYDDLSEQVTGSYHGRSTHRINLVLRVSHPRGSKMRDSGNEVGSELPTVPPKNFSDSHVRNPLLTKLVRSRRFDVGLVRFWLVYGPILHLDP